MCDYSLEAIQSRAAEVGDKLVTYKFSRAFTKGLCAANGDQEVAVCVLPGTELAFDNNIIETKLGFCGENENTVHNSAVAVFAQIDKSDPHKHHDAVELPDGTRILLNNLAVGQTLSVIQMPSQPVVMHLEMQDIEDTVCAPGAGRVVSNEKIAV